MGLIQNVLAVIVVLGLLVTFHEFGHFWVARRCGVKVLRFCVGFGKPFWSRTDRHGTEFAVAAIPLGGYVKMLDEREAPVPEDQLDQAFNRKSVWARIAIVAAGPLANFLLAIVAYWALFVAGTTTVTPLVGNVAQDSPAFEAGLSEGAEITAIQNDPMRSWEDINLKLVSMIGYTGELAIEARDGEAGPTRTYALPVDSYLARQDPPEPLQSLGITPWRPAVPAVLGQVLDDGAAADAGLETGDRIVAINDTLVEDWMAFVGIIRESAGQTLSVRIERGGERATLALTPQSTGERRRGWVHWRRGGADQLARGAHARDSLRAPRGARPGVCAHRQHDASDRGCDPQDAGGADFALQSVRAHHHRSDFR